MKRSLDLLDVVELAEEREGHAAGTVGAVIELFPDEALVEIVDENATTIDQEVLAVLNDLSEDELKALRRIGEKIEAANLDTRDPRLLVAIL